VSEIAFNPPTETGSTEMSRFNALAPWRAVTLHRAAWEDAEEYTTAQTERAVFPHSAFMNGLVRSEEKESVRQG
jgi:hypothetical protein